MGNPIVILGAKRTPLGVFQGIFSDTPAPMLAGHALKCLVSFLSIAPEAIQKLYMGCVLPAALGQAPAKQVMACAHLPFHASCVLVNKVCGSGLFSVMMACADLHHENHEGIAIAGGMENMTQAPFLLPKARLGYKMGHQILLDHMVVDGLEDVYEKKSMGHFAEKTASAYGISRKEQDDFAIESGEKAQKAAAEGMFSQEVAPFTVYKKKEPLTIEADEGLSRFFPKKIPHLLPCFQKNGTITAANSSSLADGAAVVALCTLKTATKQGIAPKAFVKGMSCVAQEPQHFTTAPVQAIEKLCKKLQWSLQDVDLFEINEAFAVVVLVAMKQLGIPPEKVNIHGGSCILGHPLGASGARILTTLLHALEKHDKKRGIASLCIGGGEAVAFAIERAC